MISKPYFTCGDIRYVYPGDVAEYIDFNKLFPDIVISDMSEEEIDKWIANLIIKHPYIDHAMYIEFNVYITFNIYTLDNREYCRSQFYHILSFKNDDFMRQLADKKNIHIKYKYEDRGIK